MAENTRDMPPRKRQRMAGPEGFQKPSRPLTTPVKVNVPNFVSGFEKPSVTSNARPSSASKPIKLMSTSKMPPAFEPFAESSSKPRSNIAKKPEMRLKPPSMPDLKARTRPDFDLSSLHTESKSIGRRLQPPLLAEPKPESTNATPMRKAAPPVFTQFPVTPSKPTTSLNAVLPPHLPTPIAREPMFPISKTTIARATDLTTDQGTAELASIFLRDQHPDISNQTHDPDNANGFWMGLSPEKGGRKGKAKEKFIRGGLAAQASVFFARSHNALALWQKEIELKLFSQSVAPVLRARIIKILDMPRPNSPSKSRGSVSFSRGVSYCQILSVNLIKTTNATHLQPRNKEPQHHLVVLTFPSSAPPRINSSSSRPHVRNPEDFVEDGELHIWEPWLEVALNGKGSPLKEEEEVGASMSIAPFPLLPSSFPFLASPTRTPTPIEANVANVALLCSRFRILRGD